MRSIDPIKGCSRSPQRILDLWNLSLNHVRLRYSGENYFSLIIGFIDASRQVRYVFLN